jgi:hypothetical protein
LTVETDGALRGYVLLTSRIVLTREVLESPVFRDEHRVLTRPGKGWFSGDDWVI